MGFRIDGSLTVSNFNQDVFKDHGKKRSGTCYATKKGASVKGAEKDELPEGAVDIQPLLSKGNPHGIAEALNKFENFY